MPVSKQVLPVVVIGMLLSKAAYAGAAQTDSWLENTMYESGKIYVVVAVLAAMLLILLAYLVRLDRRLGKLEQQEVKERNS